MGAPLAILVLGTLMSLYRITLNLPDVPFSASLRRPDQAEYREMSTRVGSAVRKLFNDVDGFYNVSVLQFRYDVVVGTMVIFDLTFTRPTEMVEEKLRQVLHDGRFGGLTVGPEGFEIVEHQANASRPTQLCSDGSLPEFSLHGSTYCWSHAVCPTGYSCVDGQCCRSGQNQKRAAVHRCETGDFRCASGECIPPSAECNRHYDCSDGTDELHCDYFNQVREQHKQDANHYHTDEIQCTDQEVKCRHSNPVKCIHYEKLCDGVRDCDRGEDEENCGFTATAPTVTIRPQSEHCPYQCKNGQCIDKKAVCNRHYDCTDGTDETLCDYFVNAQRHATESPKREEEYRRQQDEERRRIHAEHVRRLEEARREREKQETVHANIVNDPAHIEIVSLNNCQAHEFECHSGECVDKRQRCDGQRDCSNSADEFNCPQNTDKQAKTTTQASG